MEITTSNGAFTMPPLESFSVWKIKTPQEVVPPKGTWEERCGLRSHSLIVWTIPSGEIDLQFQHETSQNRQINRPVWIFP
ncbi:hypothetical protein JCM33374_g1888 [Metschnikowia sp. JCM 33374]|nr:hypothetical protein JCM33374_g1888 [Metschnikowia sp. JCM 33374]